MSNQWPKTIPIVFTRVGDPLVVGLVSNLARPGGNLSSHLWCLPTGQTVPIRMFVSFIWDPAKGTFTRCDEVLVR